MEVIEVKLTNPGQKQRHNGIIGTCLLIFMLCIVLTGCSTPTDKDSVPQATSIPQDKKYPAAVLIGTEADHARATVRTTSAPLPTGSPIFFSVRSFGGYGVNELTAELHNLTQDIPKDQPSPIFSCTLPVEAGKQNVLGTIPGLPPGQYLLRIYRADENIAARQFHVQ